MTWESEMTFHDEDIMFLFVIRIAVELQLFINWVDDHSNNEFPDAALAFLQLGPLWFNWKTNTSIIVKAMKDVMIGNDIYPENAGVMTCFRALSEVLEFPLDRVGMVTETNRVERSACCRSLPTIKCRVHLGALYCSECNTKLYTIRQDGVFWGWRDIERRAIGSFFVGYHELEKPIDGFQKQSHGVVCNANLANEIASFREMLRSGHFD